MLEPKDESELQDIVRGAAGPLAIQGGGTRASGKSLSGEVLSTKGISGVTLYEPGALTMVARAGTPLSEIEAALDAEGQMLPFEPYVLSGVTGVDSVSTIGGVFATNASGARRLQAGAARDFLLGVRFVDGRGDAISNGGRVMKNVTGYDLVKLMAGSRGTLGVITEVSFKVLPRPEAARTLVLKGLGDADAVRAMASALTSPFEVSGALHIPGGSAAEPTTLLRIEGFADSVTYREAQLSARLSPFGEVKGEDGSGLWAAARKLDDFAKAPSGTALWAVSLRASDAPSLMADISKRFTCRHLYDWGGGRIWVQAEAAANQVALHRALQDAAGRVNGHTTLVHGPAALADVVAITQPEAAPLAALAAGLRRQFDPRGILNPGLMGA